MQGERVMQFPASVAGDSPRLICSQDGHLHGVRLLQGYPERRRDKNGRGKNNFRETEMIHFSIYHVGREPEVPHTWYSDRMRSKAFAR